MRGSLHGACAAAQVCLWYSVINLVTTGYGSWVRHAMVTAQLSVGWLFLFLLEPTSDCAGRGGGD